MRRAAKDKIKSSGKPYGGIIHRAEFFTLEGPEFEGRTVFEFCRGNLSDDPRRRFGAMGNLGMRTSYIVKRTKNWIETRNTIYEFSTKWPGGNHER